MYLFGFTVDREREHTAPTDGPFYGSFCTILAGTFLASCSSATVLARFNRGFRTYTGTLLCLFFQTKNPANEHSQHPQFYVLSKYIQPTATTKAYPG